jgi:hypothetical protein
MSFQLFLPFPVCQVLFSVFSYISTHLIWFTINSSWFLCYSSPCHFTSILRQNFSSIITLAIHTLLIEQFSKNLFENDWLKFWVKTSTCHTRTLSLSYMYKVYMKHKRILCLDLDPILKVSHYVYTYIPKFENIWDLKHFWSQTFHIRDN